jgi:hypothetical protein
MKFEEYGKEVANLKISFTPFEFIESNLFRELSNLYGYIKENYSSLYGKLIQKITSKISEKPHKEHFTNKSEEIIERIAQCEYLSENRDLVIKNLNTFVETLNISPADYKSKREITIPARNFFQSAKDLDYLYLMTLVDIIGKKNAINLFQKIVDNYVMTYDSEQINIFKDLEDMQERFIRFTQNGPFGRVRLISDVEKGRWIKICKNCEKIQTLDNLQELDGELLYAISCYCHIPLARMWNKNFELTLRETIANGDSFCAYVYHDRSQVNEIDHPPKRYFEKVLKKYSVDRK